MKKNGLIFGLMAAIILCSSGAYACSDPAKCKHKNKKHNHHHNHVSKKQDAKPDPALTSCKANELAYLVGKNKSVLATMRFSMPIRVEEPNMMYTQEFSLDRLRIITDEKGTINKLVCG